ncbi:MAG: nitroreductase family protein [bacterium]|nr:nitroreductase family protein [bacterium]
MDLATVDHLLTTTRSVRKRLDLTRPVESDIIQQCIDIALQAPNGGNRGRYHFVVVTDPAKRSSLAGLYRQAWAAYTMPSEGQAGPRDFASGDHLAAHMHEVPVHIIPCIEGRVEAGTPFMQATVYGSVLPAAWSLMLALRARGLGAAWTTLHLMYEAEVAALLGIPEGMTQGALLPVAYFTGDDFQPAKRIPGRERTYWDAWGQTR